MSKNEPVRTWLQFAWIAMQRTGDCQMLMYRYANAVGIVPPANAWEDTIRRRTRIDHLLDPVR